MGKFKDILNMEIPGTPGFQKPGGPKRKKRPKPRRARRVPRLDIAVMLMILAGPVGWIYYLSIHRRMHLRRSSQVLSRIRLIVRNNAPLSEGLVHVSHDAPTGASTILLEIAGELEEGATLTEALSRYPAIVPQLYLRQIEIGEKTGQLVQALDGVIDTMQQDRQNRDEANKNQSYIGLVVLAQLGIISFLWIKVFPVFDEMLAEILAQSNVSQMQIESMLPHRMMSLATPDAIIFALATFVGAIMLCVILSRFRLGQWLVCPILYRIPFLGRVMRLKQQSHVVGALELCVRADIPMQDAFARLQGLDVTAPFRRALERIATRLEQGSSLADAMRPARHLFTKDFIEAIALGEYSNTLAQSCAYARTSTFRNLRQQTRQLTDAMIPAYAVIGGALNLWIALIMHGFIIGIANTLATP